MTIYWRQPGTSADHGIDRGGALTGGGGGPSDWRIRPAERGGAVVGLTGPAITRADPWRGPALRGAGR